MTTDTSWPSIDEATRDAFLDYYDKLTTEFIEEFLPELLPKKDRPHILGDALDNIWQMYVGGDLDTQVTDRLGKHIFNDEAAYDAVVNEVRDRFLRRSREIVANAGDAGPGR